MKAHPGGCLQPVPAEMLDELCQLSLCHTSFFVLQQLGPATPCVTASAVSRVPLRIQGADVEHSTEVVTFPISPVQGGAISANS